MCGTALRRRNERDLNVVVRVPVGVVDDDGVGGREVDAKTTSARRQQETERRRSDSYDTASLTSHKKFTYTTHPDTSRTLTLYKSCTYLLTYTHHSQISSISTETSFPVTSSRTFWRRRQLVRSKLATSYEEVSDTSDHLDMLRWSESHQLLRNFLVTNWRHARLPRN